jgi:hypothetical protein
VPEPKGTAVTDQTPPVVLPYWGEYLRQVLRPKVEQTLEEQAENWNEMVWNLVAKTIADQQPGGAPASLEQISTLLRDELGLRLQVSVSAEFVDAEPGDQPADDEPEPEVLDGVEQVQVRRRTTVSPLAAAVSSPKRK